MAQQIAFLRMININAKVSRYNARIVKALKDSGIPHTRVSHSAGVSIIVDDANIAKAAKVVLSVPLA